MLKPIVTHGKSTVIFSLIAMALVMAMALAISSPAFADSIACQIVMSQGSDHILMPASGPKMENSDLEIFDNARAVETQMVAGGAAHDHGWRILTRDAAGNATSARLRVLVDNPGYDNQLFVIGPFNNWGKNLRPSDALHPANDTPGIFSADVTGIADGMQYRLLLNGQQVLDPTAKMYNTIEYASRIGSSDIHLNSIFWDGEAPGRYQSKTNFVDVSEKPVIIAEIELQSLVAKFQAINGQVGPRTVADTYRFIAQSGVIGKLREAGYTTIELMPINQSVDGDAWNLRYQSYGIFAPDSRYGDPSELKMMIDEFHRNGMAVIVDSVISHFPFKGNNGIRSLQGIGMDQWFKGNGQKLFAGELSPWGTDRFAPANPYVRRFLIDGLTFMMTEYKIDGFRMDNIDGILSLPGGLELLKELSVAVRNVNPRATMAAEAFFPPNTLMRRADQGNFGFTTRNDSNWFDIWHNALLGPDEALDVSLFSKLLRNIFDWKEIPMMRYLTNHDEAANGRGGLTGAYPASLISGDAYYAFSKTKAADSLNMLAGAFHLSIPQARMMQTGSFYSNAAVDWSQINGGRGKNLWEYFAALSRYIQAKSSFFNFRSLSKDIDNHYDNTNKVISLKRRDPATGKILYVLVNLGSRRIANYTFGVEQQTAYRVGFDSEWSGFGGDGALEKSLQASGIQAGLQGATGKPYSLTTPVLAPYSVTIFEAQ